MSTLLERLRARDEEFRYSVAWIDCLKRGAGMGRGVLMWGDHAEEGGLDFDPPARLKVPFTAPPGLLNGLTTRAFNELYYRRAPRRPHTGPESITRFFHPLDAVLDWNRIYGPARLRAVPVGRAAGPRGRRARDDRAPERERDELVPGRAQALRRAPRAAISRSPRPGWTLALDIPAGAAGLPSVLDALDELVAGAGGRVYLAKDARVQPELLERMYPRLEEWRRLQREADPEGVMRSDLDRRLGLTR